MQFHLTEIFSVVTVCWLHFKQEDYLFAYCDGILQLQLKGESVPTQHQQEQKNEPIPDVWKNDLKPSAGHSVKDEDVNASCW